MKKALTISIAQTLFTIEEDAYQKLDGYLRSVRAHFSATEGGEEVVADIESRIAELFLASKRAIITLVEVDAVMVSMGGVEDFDDEKSSGPEMKEKKTEEERGGTKRLFRDTENGIVAGVSSGLAAYTGVDALWIRILFIVLVLSSGIGILIYIILWLAVPEAKTAAQKLEMQGSPVTIENLTENVKEKIEDVKKNPSTYFRRIIEGIVAVIGNVARAFVTVVGPIMRYGVGFFLALFGLFAIMGISIVSVGFISDAFGPYVNPSFRDLVSQGWLVFVYFTFLVPAVFLFLFAIGILRKKQFFTPALGFGLLGIWCVSVVGMTVWGITFSGEYQKILRESPEYAPVSTTYSISTSTTGLFLSGNEQVKVIQGDERSVQISGRAYDMKGLEIEEKDGLLHVKRKHFSEICFLCGTKEIEVVITMPRLETIVAESGAEVMIDSWKSETLLSTSFRLGADGVLRGIEAPEILLGAERGSDVQATVSTTHATLTAAHGSDIQMTGRAQMLEVSAVQGSDIEVSRVVAEEANATATYGAQIELGELKVLHALAEDGGSVEYVGEPILTTDGDRSGNIYQREKMEIIRESENVE